MVVSSSTLRRPSEALNGATNIVTKAMTTGADYAEYDTDVNIDAVMFKACDAWFTMSKLMQRDTDTDPDAIEDLDGAAKVFEDLIGELYKVHQLFVTHVGVLPAATNPSLGKKRLRTILKNFASG